MMNPVQMCVHVLILKVLLLNGFRHGKSGAILGAGLDADPYHIQKFTQIIAINGRSCAHYHFDRIKKLIPTLLEAGSIEVTFLAPGICEPLESKLGYRSSTSLCAKST